jgi:hypothetical protein
VIAILWTMLNMRNWEDPKRVIAWDIIEYYSYLPATFIYDDLTLNFKEDISNEFIIIGGKKIENSNYAPKMSMGLSFMYMPFFGLAHGYAKISAFPANGYSPPYRLALMISSLFYLIIGLHVLKLFLLKYFNGWIVSFTILLIVFGTNLFYYTAIESPMPHTYNFALIIIFLYFTKCWYLNPTLIKSIIIGLLAGLISLIRPSNLIVLVLFIFYNISSWDDIIHRTKEWLKNWHHLFIMVVLGLIVWIPQFLYWKHVTGEWIFYSYQDEGFFFKNPQIIKGLFSYRKGWLLYTPIMFFAIIGIYYTRKKAQDVFLPVIIYTILNIYVIFSWWTWWYGGSFGQRPMIDSYGLLAIPLAVMIEKIVGFKRWLKIVLFSIIGFLFLHSIFQTIQYYYGAIHWDSMTKEAYWNSFGRVRGSYKFQDLIVKPDYELAKKGIYPDTLKNKTDYTELNVNNYMTIDSIKSSAEKKKPNSNSFVSNKPGYFFENSSLQTSKESYTGDYAILLDNKNSFGFTIELDTIPRETDIILVTVKVQGKGDRFLVVSTGAPNQLYLAQYSAYKEFKNGWKEIRIVLENDEISLPLKTYVWNKKGKKNYFDDFSIYFLKEKTGH